MLLGKTESIWKLIFFLAFVFMVQDIGARRDIKQSQVVPNPCINLSGFEYPDKSIYPTTETIDYYISKGFNTIRFPIRWERLQPVLRGDFDAAFFDIYKGLCDYAVEKGGWCVIDVHNYGYFNSAPINQGGIPSFEDFQDLWTKLATVPGWNSNEHVWFCLMNEPNGFDTAVVRAFMQSGIDAIRSTGANNWIIVNGNGYSGAYSWVSQNWYGVANGQLFTGLTDGNLNKIIVDAHSYLDSDNSGTSEVCPSPTLGVERLTEFITWVRANGYKAMIGEVGSGQSQSCLTAVDNMMAYLSQQNDVTLSWCWWAGGPVWDPSYVSLLDPVGGVDKPQLSVLQKYV